MGKQIIHEYFVPYLNELKRDGYGWHLNKLNRLVNGCLEAGRAGGQAAYENSDSSVSFIFYYLLYAIYFGARPSCKCR